MVFNSSAKSKPGQVEPEKIGVTVIQGDEEQYFINASSEKSPVMIPQMGSGSGFDLFTAIMIPLQLVIVVLYGLFGEYGDGLDIGRYPLYQVGNI
jgi:hypothetical protein